MSEPKTVILIPAYCPDEKLIGVLKALRGDFSLCVVDDGSGEAYAPIFAQARQYAHVLQYAENHGKGYALKYGFSKLRALFPEALYVVTADADGQHRPEDIRAVEFALTEETRDSAVLGSRRMQGKIPFRSRFGNGVTRTVFHLATGKRVYDTQTGLRGFPVSLLERLVQLDGDRYEYEMNVLITLAQEKYPIREVAIDSVYLEDNASSHFHPIKDSARIYKLIFRHATGLKFLLASLCGFLTYYLLTLLLEPAFSKSDFSMEIASTVAWVASSQVNFWLNRCFAFRSKGALAKELAGYYALAVLNYACKVYLLQALFYRYCNVALWLTIPVSEVLMYLLNFLVEKKFIFRKKSK